jgi:S-DNA-T family DNA segregation ATPase FtsK/SpoIIIE
MAKSVKRKLRTLHQDCKSWEFTKQHKFVLGALLVLFSIAPIGFFCVFYIHRVNRDQNSVFEFGDRNENCRNWLGKMGTCFSF